eukprot:superscaffoldBa00002112_g13226
MNWPDMDPAHMLKEVEDNFTTEVPLPSATESPLPSTTKTPVSRPSTSPSSLATSLLSPCCTSPSLLSLLICSNLLFLLGCNNLLFLLGSSNILLLLVHSNLLLSCNSLLFLNCNSSLLWLYFSSLLPPWLLLLTCKTPSHQLCRLVSSQTFRTVGLQSVISANSQPGLPDHQSAIFADGKPDLQLPASCSALQWSASSAPCPNLQLDLLVIFLASGFIAVLQSGPGFVSDLQSSPGFVVNFQNGPHIWSPS